MIKRTTDDALLDVLMATDLISRYTKKIKTSEELLKNEALLAVVTKECIILSEAIKEIINEKAFEKNIKPSWKSFLTCGKDQSTLWETISKEVPQLEPDLIDFVSSFPSQEHFIERLDAMRREMEKINRTRSVEFLRKIKKTLKNKKEA